LLTVFVLCVTCLDTADTGGSVTARVRGYTSGYITACISPAALWLRSGVGTADTGGSVTARVCG